MVYKITPHTFERAREVGLEVRPSTRKGKKLDVYVGSLDPRYTGQYVDSVGALGYSDYGTFLGKDGPAVADERRRLYRIRHRGKTLGELLALWLLW